MDVSSSGSKRFRTGSLCFPGALLLAASVLWAAPGMGVEATPKPTDSAKTLPSEIELFEILSEACTLLKTGQIEAAEQRVDGLRETWRTVLGPNDAGIRQLEVWLSDFELLKKRSPSVIGEYVEARADAREMAGLVYSMNGRKLPHGPSLNEAETKLHHCVEVLQRCLDSKSHQAIVCQTWLGRVDACRRDWQAAEESFERALELTMANFPDDDRGIAETRQWLAWTLMMQDENFPRQKEHLLSVIASAKACHGNEETRYWRERAMTLLAEATYRSGDRKDADRLFAEVRRWLPKDPKPCPNGKCTNSCYVFWCLAWCDRHDARALITDGKYQEAVAAIERAVKELANGDKRELNEGVTIQDLHCLKAEASYALGKESDVDMEIASANVIAGHAAELRGEAHEPLEPPGPADARDRQGYRCAKTTVKIICTRNCESLFVSRTSLSLGTGQIKNFIAATLKDPPCIAEDDWIRQRILRVEKDLTECQLAGALNSARAMHSDLLADVGPESGDVQAVAKLVDRLQLLQDLSEHDREAFFRAFQTLIRGRWDLWTAQKSVFPSFTLVNSAVERLTLANELFGQLPEPARGFQQSCLAHLGVACILQRNWTEAEEFLSQVHQQPDDHRWLTDRSPPVPGLLAYVLQQQGKDYPRQQELLQTLIDSVRKQPRRDRYAGVDKILMLRLAEVHGSHGDRDHADRIYEEVRSRLEEEDCTRDYCLSLCDQDRARTLLEANDLDGACAAIEDAYRRLLVHGGIAFNYGLETEEVLRLRATIYERFERKKDAEADVAFADDIARSAATLCRMCSADPEQRKKWAKTKLTVPSLPGESSEDAKCSEKLLEQVESVLQSWATGKTVTAPPPPVPPSEP